MTAAQKDGLRVLVVEDESMIAMMLEGALEQAGYRIVGPVPSVKAALALLQGKAQVDAALLDIQLGMEKVFPVADALEARGVPFVFLSGYGAQILPDRYAGRPVLAKPYRIGPMLSALGGAIATAPR